MNREIQLGLEKNIAKLNLMSLFTNTQFHQVIFTLFILSKGFSMQQFFIIEAAGALMALIFQIPTGAFSDRINRKWSLVIGSLINIPIIAIIILSHSFWVVLVAMALGGLSGAFTSGADSAMLYDTAKAIGQKDNFKKINGNFKWYGGLAGAIGGIVGGILAQINMSYAWWAYFVASVAVLIVQLTLKNPPKEIEENVNYNHHVGKSLKLAFKGEAAYFVFFAAITWLFFSLGYWLWQPYLKSIAVPILYFGIVYAVIDVVSGFVSKHSHKIEKKIGIKSSLLAIPLVLALSFVLQSTLIAIFGVLFLLIHSVISGYQGPVLEDYLHSRIPSSNRATVISVKNMINSGLFVILSPLLGRMVDLYSLRTTYLLMFGALLIVAVVFGVTFHKVKTNG